MITPKQPSPIPEHASKFIFYHRGVLMEYYLWSAASTGYWYWSAGGNQGIEPSIHEAGAKARRWLRDGQ